MGFSEELYKLRKEAGLSQKELAEKIGVAQASINYWEKKQRTPSISMLTLVADYFNVSLESLLTRNEHTQLEEYEQKQREEAARKAPRAFIIENGKRVEADKPVKFTSPSRSHAQTEAYDLFHSLLSEDWIISQEQETTAIQLREMLGAYNKLNDSGRKEAVKRVEELTEIPRYTKPATPP